MPRFFLRGFAAPESDRQRNPFVWLGSLKSREIVRRSPKNISISRGYYDGPGGFAADGASIEAHLAGIESAAAAAISGIAVELQDGMVVPSQIWRFLAWQAARTPGWAELVQRWANESWNTELVEAPPDGLGAIVERERPILLEEPDSGERRELTDQIEVDRLRDLGWRWILRAGMTFWKVYIFRLGISKSVTFQGCLGRA